MLTVDRLTREAAEAGFRPESFEKVARLSDLMAGLRSHPHLTWTRRTGATSVRTA